MINLNEIKITPRNQQLQRIMVQGCSNKEIASHLNISPRTVKQHGRKRVKLAPPCLSRSKCSHATR